LPLISSAVESCRTENITLLPVEVSWYASPKKCDFKSSPEGSFTCSAAYELALLVNRAECDAPRARIPFVVKANSGLLSTRETPAWFVTQRWTPVDSSTMRFVVWNIVPEMFVRDTTFDQTR